MTAGREKQWTPLATHREEAVDHWVEVLRELADAPTIQALERSGAPEVLTHRRDRRYVLLPA